MTTSIKPEVKKEKFVTAEQLDKSISGITEVLSKLADSINELKSKTATPAETKEAKEIEKAGWDNAPMNPAWEEKAQEILGEYMDHCYLTYPKGGGQLFTVVIKADLSNAPKDYIERYKIDKRTREIGTEGIAGVELWCKTIRANLKKSAAK